MKWPLWIMSGSSCVLATCATPDTAAPPAEPEVTDTAPTPATDTAEGPAEITVPVDLLEDTSVHSCDGSEVSRGGQKLVELNDASLATYAPMMVNADGAKKAYHPLNAEGGAILHLCNAGKVHLPDGTSYHGSESNETCTGKFMEDVERIRAAGWDDPTVGAVSWYGIYAEGQVRIADRPVKNIRPFQSAEGFYISPTALEDRAFRPEDQRRYVDAVTVPHAVVRGNSGVPLGTFGVAWRVKGCPEDRMCEPVPFIVGDIGPKIGEGSIAMTRLVNGLEVTSDITQENRFDGAVSAEDDILWVFFGGNPAMTPYTLNSVRRRAARAFEGWGGKARLETCLAAEVPEANGE